MGGGYAQPASWGLASLQKWVDEGSRVESMLFVLVRCVPSNLMVSIGAQGLCGEQGGAF